MGRASGNGGPVQRHRPAPGLDEGGAGAAPVPTRTRPDGSEADLVALGVEPVGGVAALGDAGAELGLGEGAVVVGVPGHEGAGHAGEGGAGTGAGVELGAGEAAVVVFVPVVVEGGAELGLGDVVVA